MNLCSPTCLIPRLLPRKDLVEGLIHIEMAHAEENDNLLSRSADYRKKKNLIKHSHSLDKIEEKKHWNTMKVLFNPEPSSLSPVNSIFPNNLRTSTRFHLRPFLKPCDEDRHRLIGRRRFSLAPKAAFDSVTVEQFGIPKFDVHNPAPSDMSLSLASLQPSNAALTTLHASKVLRIPLNVVV
ncbi:hypothetical protein RJT34_03490 [Clitoria ternatea]|uniref:Uncharacterized protein n=1 Tax=Clitoria ternatea TaxID=43366 RepID=A0AAN9Q549_CLITE